MHAFWRIEKNWNVLIEWKFFCWTDGRNWVTVWVSDTPATQLLLITTIQGDWHNYYIFSFHSLYFPVSNGRKRKRRNSPKWFNYRETQLDKIILTETHLNCDFTIIPPFLVECPFYCSTFSRALLSNKLAGTHTVNEWNGIPSWGHATQQSDSQTDRQTDQPPTRQI